MLDRTLSRAEIVGSLLLCLGLAVWWFWEPSHSAPPSADGPRSLCERVLETAKTHCPRVGDLRLADCVLSDEPFTNRFDLALLGSGKFVHFGLPGPEWFAADDRTFLTANNAAENACDGPLTVEQHIRKKAGDVPNSEIPTADACSAADIRAGRVIEKQLAKANENVSDGDEMLRKEAAAFRRAAKTLGITAKEARELWTRVDTQCPGAL